MALCTAHSSRTGEPCKKHAIRGGTVCTTHGGSIPAVKAKAAERLAALQDPAVTALAQAMDADSVQLDRKGNVRTLGPDHAARTRAATAVLDRTGLGPSSQTEVQVHASVHLHTLIEALDREPPKEITNEAAPKDGSVIDIPLAQP